MPVSRNVKILFEKVGTYVLGKRRLRFLTEVLNNEWFLLHILPNFSFVILLAKHEIQIFPSPRLRQNLARRRR